MKMIANLACMATASVLLTACGGTDKETTIVHDRPVIVQPATSSSVESNCKHGYDNDSHSCY